MPRISSPTSRNLTAFGSAQAEIPLTLEVEYLLVGGGGGGGQDIGGGGGGGGYKSGTMTMYRGDSYTVTVGAGGNSAYSTSVSGNQGTGSGFNGGAALVNISVLGGGGGKSRYSGVSNSTGGSGGGGGHTNTTAGLGTPGMGYDGGTSTDGRSGGGGGAGGPGENYSGPSAGNGGPGATWLNGVTYAGGGGGGAQTYFGYTPGIGGSGGGGNAQNDSQPGLPGTNGLGGGGGGQGSSGSGSGGVGGDGTVIFRYAGNRVLTGGTVSSSGGYTYHTFLYESGVSTSTLTYPGETAPAGTMTISADTYSITESGSVTFTINTIGLANGTTLYYENIGTTVDSDFTGATYQVCGTSGEESTLVMTPPAGSIFTGITFASYGTPTGTCGSFATGACHLSDTSTRVYDYVFNDKSPGEGVGTGANYNVSGGGPVSIPVRYWFFGDPCPGTAKQLYLQMTATDLSGVPVDNKGSFVINNNVGTVTLSMNPDSSIELDETIILRIRTDSASGPIRATSNPVKVISSSPSQNVTITPSVSSVNEGGSVTMSVTTTGLPNGYTLYWTISGTASGSDLSQEAGDSFTITNGSGSFTVPILADSTTEGAETFAVQIRKGSPTGDIVATTTNITINDTSTAPSYSATAAWEWVDTNADLAYITTNKDYYFGLSTSNVPIGTVFYWENIGTATSADFTTIDHTDTQLIDVQAGESGTASLTVPNGYMVVDITFASYGNPTGTFPNYGIGSCHQPASKSVCGKYWMHKTAGTYNFNASNNAFGDPCSGTAKYFRAIVKVGRIVQGNSGYLTSYDYLSYVQFNTNNQYSSSLGTIRLQWRLGGPTGDIVATSYYPYQITTDKTMDFISATNTQSTPDSIPSLITETDPIRGINMVVIMIERIGGTVNYLDSPGWETIYEGGDTSNEYVKISWKQYSRADFTSGTTYIPKGASSTSRACTLLSFTSVGKLDTIYVNSVNFTSSSSTSAITNQALNMAGSTTSTPHIGMAVALFTGSGTKTLTVSGGDNSWTFNNGGGGTTTFAMIVRGRLYSTLSDYGTAPQDMTWSTSDAGTQRLLTIHLEPSFSR